MQSKMKRNILFILAAAALVLVWSHHGHTAHGQAVSDAYSLENGDWTLTFDMGGSSPSFSLNVDDSADDKVISIRSGDHLVPIVSTIKEDVLTLDIEMDHGKIECTLIAQKGGEYSGACGGPAGEIPAKMTKDQSAEVN